MERIFTESARRCGEYEYKFICLIDPFGGKQQGIGFGDKIELRL